MKSIVEHSDEDKGEDWEENEENDEMEVVNNTVMDFTKEN